MRARLSLPLALLALSLTACAATSPVRVVRASRLFVGDGRVETDRRIWIRDGMIERVEADEGPLELSPGERVLDARGKTVIPGLIEGHNHMLMSGACDPAVGAGAGQSARNLQAHRAAGVTTVVDLGTPVGVALGARGWVSDPTRARGPALVVAGPVLTAAGGYMSRDAAGEPIPPAFAHQLADPEAGREVVRRLAARGVDLIKVTLQDRHFNREALPPMPAPVLCAVVEEAHAHRLRVVAHATEAATWARALSCGVDAIAHGSTEPLPDALVAELAEAGVVVLPSLFVFEAQAWGPAHMGAFIGDRFRAQANPAIIADLQRFKREYDAGGQTLPSSFVAGVHRADFEEAQAHLQENLRRLAAAGVPLGMGSDAGVCFNPPGYPGRELERMVSAGLSPSQALSAATWGGARYIGREDTLGLIAPGYQADLVVIDGAPDQEIRDLERVEAVVQQGVEGPQRATGGWDVLSFFWVLLWGVAAS